MTLPFSFSILCDSEDSTRAVGRALGCALMPGLTVLLWGDLGSGKTVLVRGIGDALGAKHVRSPSFTLINEYRTEKLFLAHADLYRLDEAGVEALGLDEYVGASDATLLVEWPERWSNPPTETLSISFQSPDETSRLLTFTVTSESAEKVARLVLDAVNMGKCVGTRLYPKDNGIINDEQKNSCNRLQFAFNRGRLDRR